jgi:hypothetical protein
VHFRKNQLGKNRDQSYGDCGAAATHPPSLSPRLRIAVCFLVLAVVVAGAAQAGQQPTPSASTALPIVSQEPQANSPTQVQEQPARQQAGEPANADRGRQIAEQSAKLLQLATSLKAEVDKSNKDTLSIAVYRKANEIERLAHSVREAMKLTAGSN